MGNGSIIRIPRASACAFTNTAEDCSGPPGTPRGQSSCVLVEKSGPSYEATKSTKGESKLKNPALWFGPILTAVLQRCKTFLNRIDNYQHSARPFIKEFLLRLSKFTCRWWFVPVLDFHKNGVPLIGHQQIRYAVALRNDANYSTRLA